MPHFPSIFVIPVVAPSNGTMPPPTLHPSHASSLRTPHCERQLSVDCYLFLLSFSHLMQRCHFPSFSSFQSSPQRMGRRPPPRSTPAVPLLSGPPSRTPTLGWLLRLTIKFQPPKAKAPFPLYFFRRSNRRPKRWDDAPPRAPPRPCLFNQHPPS